MLININKVLGDMMGKTPKGRTILDSPADLTGKIFNPFIWDLGSSRLNPVRSNVIWGQILRRELF